MKQRAMRLDSGNFNWVNEHVTMKTRILDVVYNASSNELVRTKTLVKSAIIQIDATPFKQYYEKHYGVSIGSARGEKKEETEWHRVSAFGRLAEIMGEYLKKGSQVYIEGRLRTRKWQDKEGKERYSTEIVANEMQMLGGRGDAFVVAQVRLGGGRLHHAMRTVAQARRALEMMCERALSRSTKGELLARKQMVQEKIAEGMLNKWYAENNLMDQEFTKDPTRGKVSDVVRKVGSETGGEIRVNRITRSVLGESTAAPAAE